MDAQAVIEVIGVLIVAFVLGVVLPLVLLFLYIRYRGGNEEMYQTAAALRAGTVADLLPWGSTSLGELTREWVGSSTYTANMFGRNDESAGKVPSTTESSGWLLAFCVDSKNSGATGKVVAMTSAHRLELHIASGSCQVTLNGAALGSFKQGEAGLFGADGAQLGSFRAGGQLVLRGREVATLDHRSSSASARPASLTPLVATLLTERTPEDEAWTLAVAVYQMGWVGLGIP